ncbi:MAG: ParA family protein [Lachnospiraceae bacterium]|nr:ParA family protein [Lachnospiraceae bacterium]
MKLISGRLSIICGHYGTGKTNLALNLARDHARMGEKVTIVDMDIVNPYFRTSDYRKILEDEGIEVIAPVFGATNLDLPSLPASMYMAFEKEGTVIFDLGGDDVGATVMGRFSDRLVGVDYEMLYVINRYRDLGATPDGTVQILKEIEAVTRLKATGLINNSNLMYETTTEHIEKGYEFVKETAELIGLPLVANVVRRDLLPDISGSSVIRTGEMIPVDIIAGPSFLD